MRNEANDVDVFCELANGRTYSESWTTPLSFGRALGKGARWMRQELAKNKVPGRSQIVSMRVTVRRTGKPYNDQQRREK